MSKRTLLNLEQLEEREVPSITAIDINTGNNGADSSAPSAITELNGFAYFFATHQVNDVETTALFKSNGTAAGTQSIFNFAEGASPDKLLGVTALPEESGQDNGG